MSSAPRLEKGGDILMLNARSRLVTDDDTYLDRVSKYVPVEIVGAYLAINRLFSPGDSLVWMTLFFGLCCLLTPVYVWRLAKPQNRPWMFHALISSFAFPIWAFAIGGPMFAKWLEAHPSAAPHFLPSALLIVFSLCVGLFDQNGRFTFR